ncbi:CBS domain-containing protein [Cocos nucifera]|uniref:CBS domain-containing protein n=1 Tax=Cocos nucifera TaxID=13894 RepID=A0A8K0IL19_COCNU|nr:CBS domain-containing protein [Cocos nucifera]
MVCSSIQGGLLLPLPSGCAKGFTSRPSSILEHNAAGLATSYSERSGRGCLKSRASIGDLRPELDENPERIISGEWPENFSLLVYDDFRAYLDSQATTHKHELGTLEGGSLLCSKPDLLRPSSLLGEVMSTPIRVAMADQMLEEIDHHFELVSGLPVVDSELRCVGIVSKNDRAKASNGLKTKVGEVMSSPAITLSPHKTVKDAAALMLRMKIHRIPILNEEGQVIGMVTRSDVLQALEAVEV